MLDDIVEHILDFRSLTRQDLCGALEVTPGAITKYVHWLHERELLVRELTPRSWSKRPVEDLSINPDAGSGLALMITGEWVDAQWILLDGTVQRTWREAVCARTQRCVLGTLSALVERALSEMFGTPDMVGVAVRGFAANDTIFEVEGIDDWVPCQPGLILKPLESLEVATVHPETQCRMCGFAREHGITDELAYVQIVDGAFHIAAIHHGRSILGGQGTTSPLVHQTVSDSDTQCICGRTGCLANHIRQGDATDAMLAHGLYRVLEGIGIDQVALDVEPRHAGLAAALSDRSFRVHEIGADSGIFALRGLAHFTAKDALRAIVHRRQGGHSAALPYEIHRITPKDRNKTAANHPQQRR